MQDDPDSDSFSGDNVFDVYTKSLGTGLDGTSIRTGKMLRKLLLAPPAGEPVFVTLCSYARIIVRAEAVLAK